MGLLLGRWRLRQAVGGKVCHLPLGVTAGDLTFAGG
jgi:hypothetical protein